MAVGVGALLLAGECRTEANVGSPSSVCFNRAYYIDNEKLTWHGNPVSKS